MPEKVLATKKETKMIFSVKPNLVRIGETIVAEGVLQDSQDRPLANKKIVFTYDAAWNYGGI